MKRTLAVGVAVVALYAAVVGLTGARSGRGIRPLFEGAGPSQPYQWVKPPPQFAATNTVPKPGTNDIPFVNGQTPAALASTPDSQFIVNFSAKAFPPRAGDTSIHIVTTPLAPSTLGAVTGGQHADGNVYRIQYTYRPSGVPVGTLAATADVIMNAPSATASMLHATDGIAWAPVPNSQQVGAPSTIGAPLVGAGYYLATSSGATPTPANAGKSGGGLGTVLIAVAVGLVAVGLGALVLVRRRRHAGASRAEARRRARPGAAGSAGARSATKSSRKPPPTKSR